MAHIEDRWKRAFMFTLRLTRALVLLVAILVAIVLLDRLARRPRRGQRSRDGTLITHLTNPQERQPNVHRKPVRQAQPVNPHPRRRPRDGKRTRLVTVEELLALARALNVPSRPVPRPGRAAAGARRPGAAETQRKDGTMKRWLHRRRERLAELVCWLLADHDQAGRDL